MKGWIEPNTADALGWQVRAAGLDEPVREHRFHPTRRWRFDLAWPDRMVAVEVDGGTRVVGRHVRGAGYEADCEKVNEATVAGWSVFGVTPRMIEDGRALGWIEKVLAR